MRSLASLRNDSPVPYVGRRALPGSTMLPTRHDARAQMQAMGTVSTLFGIVDKTSNAVAQVDWKLYRKRTDMRRRYAADTEDTRIEVTAHAALDLINKPNDFYHRQEFFETSQQHMDLTGETWWVVERDSRFNIPLGLWPVRPDRMLPVPHPEKYLSGYIYLGPEGERVPLDLNQVIFSRHPNPLDPYRGLGPVQSIMVDLDSTRYSAQWNRNFFANSAEPGGLIEVATELNDKQFRRLRDQWNEQHRGVSNAHRVALLEGGAKWVDRSYSMRDMQFAELRGVSREVILEAFGMPEFAIGRIKDVNRATADASMVWFAQQITKPRLERFKQALNYDLLPMFDADPNLEFDYCDPTPIDRDADNNERTSKAQAFMYLVNAGADPTEAAQAVGLPPMAMRDVAPQLTAPVPSGAV